MVWQTLIFLKIKIIINYYVFIFKALSCFFHGRLQLLTHLLFTKSLHQLISDQMMFVAIIFFFLLCIYIAFYSFAFLQFLTFNLSSLRSSMMMQN